MKRYISKVEKYFKVGIILVDLALINFAYILAFLVKFRGDVPDINLHAYLEVAPFITLAALVYFDVFGLLKFHRKTVYETISSIMTVVFILGITTVAMAYFTQGYSFPRSILLSAPLIQLVLLSIWKGFILYIKQLYLDEMSLMVIGDRNEVDTIIDKVQHTLSTSNFNIRYVFYSSQMEEALKKVKDVNEVLICAGIPDDQKMSIITQCIIDKRAVYIVPQLFEISLFNARMVQFEDVPAFMIDRLGLTVEQRFFKRAFDLFLAVAGIILASPIMALTALAVKLTSKGPAIYSQTRMTNNNRTFRIYKFRTMRVDAEKETGPVISERDDPRTTPVGRFLRKAKLDELPQLFNVLLGHMSFVGPRPERPFFVEQFCKEIPEYRYRSLVKAGLTGYAQVLGKYDTSPEDKLRYDLLYIKNYSMLLDIKLILQTVKVFFAGAGLYQRSIYRDNRYLRERSKAANF